MNTILEPGAVDWIEENIKPSMVVFEYGMGLSTIFFCSRVKEVVSVECYPERHSKFEELKSGIKSSYHITYTLIRPERDPKPFPYSHESYNSVDKDFEHLNLKEYVNNIKEHENKFDMVFINGRARASCIRTAVPKIKRGGFLILNDSERYEYQDAIGLFLKKYPHLEFGEDTRKTGIWNIND